jgi:hypothetical protein
MPHPQDGLTVYLRPSHFGGIFAISDLVKFFMHMLHCSVEGGTPKELESVSGRREWIFGPLIKV